MYVTAGFTHVWCMYVCNKLQDDEQVLDANMQHVLIKEHVPDMYVMAGLTYVCMYAERLHTNK